jgi:hypothetical protein
MHPEILGVILLIQIIVEQRAIRQQSHGQESWWSLDFCWAKLYTVMVLGIIL